jgi:hypothetical protein
MIYRYIERNCDKAIFAAEFHSLDTDPVGIIGPVDRWQAIEDGGSDPGGYDWEDEDSVIELDSSTFPLGWTLIPRGDW